MNVGTLSRYIVYQGQVLNLVYSSWKCKDQEYVQTLELPKNSDVLRLKFKVFAQAGDEIFLRFDYLEHPDDWFYVFNSADIRLRKMFQPRNTLYGENQYPAVGGLLIDNTAKMPLQIFPKFPLGVGMDHNQSFQLHLHRNPQYDDGLGLGGGLEDSHPVEHDFLITMNELDFTDIWRNYLLHKNSPIIFGVTTYPSFISLDLNKQQTWYSDWKTETEYSLTEEDPCVYLSSLVVRQGKKYAKVLNICDSPQVFHLDGYDVQQEVLINENAIPESRNKIMVDGEKISWELNENSGDNVLRAPNASQQGMIGSFHFKAYELIEQTSWYAYLFGYTKK